MPYLPLITRVAVAGMLWVACFQAQAHGTLRVGMALSDLPVLNGAPDQGTIGIEYGGYTIFDPLIEWDLSKSDTAATLRPGLATTWQLDPGDPTHTHWILDLRKGVKFQDGSEFNADAVIFNFERIFDRNSPEWNIDVQKQMAAYVTDVQSWKKLNDFQIEITTNKADAFFPYQLTYMLIASPAQWQKTGKNWAAFAQQPSGTGPWKLAKLIPHQRIELVPNEQYWDKARIPRLDSLVLLPIPDPSARAAALLSHAVDWIDSPPPDTVARMQASGFVIAKNAIPHVWPYTLSLQPGSPFQDIRVRKAINLAIDRDGLVKLLHGLAIPATGQVEPGNPWYGNPTFHVRYDPTEAKKLLSEAGYSTQHPLNLTFAISTSGSGQMYPLMMNEFIQENLRSVGVNLQFKVFEWEALRGRRRLGSAAPENKGIDALNNSWSTNEPYVALIRYLDPAEMPPQGTNWGGVNNPQITALIHQAREEFDPAKQNILLAQIHTLFVDNAYFVWVVHDVGAQAMSADVQGYVHPQSWFSDLTSVSMKP